MLSLCAAWALMVQQEVAVEAGGTASAVGRRVLAVKTESPHRHVKWAAPGDGGVHMDIRKFARANQSHDYFNGLTGYVDAGFGKDAYLLTQALVDWSDPVEKTQTVTLPPSSLWADELSSIIAAAEATEDAVQLLPYADFLGTQDASGRYAKVDAPPPWAAEVAFADPLPLQRKACVGSLVGTSGNCTDWEFGGSKYPQACYGADGHAGSGMPGRCYIPRHKQCRLGLPPQQKRLLSLEPEQKKTPPGDACRPGTTCMPLLTRTLHVGDGSKPTVTRTVAHRGHWCVDAEVCPNKETKPDEEALQDAWQAKADACARAAQLAATECWDDGNCRFIFTDNLKTSLTDVLRRLTDDLLGHLYKDDPREADRTSAYGDVAG